MNINLALQNEQEQQALEGFAVPKERRGLESAAIAEQCRVAPATAPACINDNCALAAKIDHQTELYFQGEFEGATGLLEPTYPHDQYYWEGYCVGLKEYWMNRKPFVKATEVF